jgi:hypothetical protein
VGSRSSRLAREGRLQLRLVRRPRFDWLACCRPSCSGLSFAPLAAARNGSCAARARRGQRVTRRASSRFRVAFAATRQQRQRECKQRREVSPRRVGHTGTYAKFMPSLHASPLHPISAGRHIPPPQPSRVSGRAGAPEPHRGSLLHAGQAQKSPAEAFVLNQLPRPAVVIRSSAQRRAGGGGWGSDGRGSAVPRAQLLRAIRA